MKPMYPETQAEQLSLKRQSERWALLRILDIWLVRFEGTWQNKRRGKVMPRRFQHHRVQARFCLLHDGPINQETGGQEQRLYWEGQQRRRWSYVQGTSRLELEFRIFYTERGVGVGWLLQSLVSVENPCPRSCPWVSSDLPINLQ